MKTPRLYPLFASLLLLATPAGAQTAAPAAVPVNAAGRRLTYPFDAAWDFHKYEGDETAATPLTWRRVDLPHDWSIEGPFDANAPSTGSGGFVPTGRAVYHKSFTLPVEAKTRRVEIQFDGIMDNGEVFINGHSFGVRPSGYVSVHYDLTPYLTVGPDQPNTLYVNVNNSFQPASRYYTGSGIERHVRLVITNPVHVETWGHYITSTVANNTATVHVQTTVKNDGAAPRTVLLMTSLQAPGSAPLKSARTDPKTIPAGQSATFEQDIGLPNPKLWDLDTPNLYNAITSVMDDTSALDSQTTSFGIRTIEFKPETGFWLNGKNVKILGVCVHEDGGAVGEAVPRSVYEERFSTLKALGVNAIRMAHNPPNPIELDVCDQLGLLVMDEMFDCWTVAKPGSAQGYNLFFTEWSLPDLRDAVMRDRNHPSIILWSAGNEIHDTPQEAKALGILTGLVKEFHRVDPSRPVTQALFRPNTSHDYDNGLADLLDVVGTNYRYTELLAAQVAKPSRTLVDTEEKQDAKTWTDIRDHPQLSGCFLWAGIDYLGEAGAWPNISSGAGIIDRTLLPKTNGFERSSWWSTKPVVYLVRNGGAGGGRGGAPGAGGGNAPDWSPPEGGSTQAAVSVYSNCAEVELFLNGQSLGAKPLPANASPRTWNVAYAPGTLRAVGRNGGKDAASDELRTAGPAAKVMLTANRTRATPTFDDVVFVRAVITDAQGVRVPSAQNQVSFKVSGPGAIVATDNGVGRDHTPFASPDREARNGNLLALVRATASSGKIVVTASVDGLQAGSLTLDAAPVPEEQ